MLIKENEGRFSRKCFAWAVKVDVRQMFHAKGAKVYRQGRKDQIISLGALREIGSLFIAKAAKIDRNVR
jgi:hypothetical protein